MNYIYSFAMVLVAAFGGAWLIKLSNENVEWASAGYAILGMTWAAACLGMAARVL